MFKTVAIKFRQRGLELPWISPLGNFPNYPRFRVDDDEKCDPTITTIFGEPVFYKKELDVYSNPTNDIINIDLPDEKNGRLMLYNINGEVLFNENNQFGRKTIHVNHLSSGIYFIEFIPDNNPEFLIYTSKLVIE